MAQDASSKHGRGILKKKNDNIPPSLAPCEVCPNRIYPTMLVQHKWVRKAL